jgi:hypothetical protein
MHGSTGRDTPSPLDIVRGIAASDLLVFGRGNGKLDTAIDHISLPAGYACPGARDCLARAVKRDGGRWGVEDGPDVLYRCFSASEEARYPNVRQIRQHNFDMLCRYAGHGRTVAEKAARMAALILASLPIRDRAFDLAVDGRPYKLVIRLHIGGDFFSQPYMDAWLMVCEMRPDLLAYAYTKSLPFWCRRLDSIPANLVLTASEGGKYDHLIKQHALRTARVVFSLDEAAALGLELDRDDSHAMRRGPSFALLLHGPQPKGTPAAKAVAALRDRDEHGHGKVAARRRREAARRRPLPIAG